MSRILVVGATRGLGASLAKHYASSSNNTVWGTTRADWAPKGFPENINWACGVDLMKPEVGNILTSQLSSEPLDLVVRLLQLAYLCLYTGSAAVQLLIPF